MTSAHDDRTPSGPNAEAPESRSEGTSCRLILSLLHPRPGHVLVRAHGEIDLGTVDALRRLLGDLGLGPGPSTGQRPSHVQCDLGGVTFLAAAGVGALADADHHARHRGIRLSLIDSSRPVHRVLELCGLDRELTIVSHRIEAFDDDARDEAPGEGPCTVPTPRNAS